MTADSASPQARPWASARPDASFTYAGTPAPARDFHRSIPGYAVTPLIDVPDLARRWGVASVHVKDESDRFGLPAFKVLGASWAVNRALCAQAAREPATTFGELQAVAGTRHTCLVTATDGNHGRALARIAHLLGLAARIYVPGGLPATTTDAIAAEGAEVIDTGLVYDDAVRAAAASIGAADLLIQDTAWPGYEQVPGWIIDGYATLFAEIDDAVTAPVGLVAVPTGVGSLLQAALQHYRRDGLAPRPAVLAVEPATAACVTASLAAGEPVTVDTSAPTSMAGLNCGTVSMTAWPLIRAGLDAGLGVAEAEAYWALNLLRDNGIGAGPCGAASLAGVEAALAETRGRDALGVGPITRIVLISTEGAAANAGLDPR